MLAILLAGVLSADQPAFTSREVDVRVGGEKVEVRLIKPSSPDRPKALVLFASGDGGLHGASGDILEHLAKAGYWIVGFSSPDAFEHALESTGKAPNYLATRETFAAIVAQAKREFGMPEDMPLIVTGMSRGANVVIAAAGDPVLNRGVVGAVAIALTREFDDLTIPESAKQQLGVETDAKGRIQTYPAIKRLGAIPLAIIQSTNDSYVKSAESRKLLGPDTPTRRLYEVKSRNHSFGGGKDALMRDLDDALAWMASLKPQAPGGR